MDTLLRLNAFSRTDRVLAGLRAWIRLCKIHSVAIHRDNRGQDFLEYALLAGFVALAAGTFMPSVNSSISIIFSKIVSLLSLV